MGDIYATCGHKIEWEWQERGAVEWKDYSREGDRVACYGVLCPECLGDYEREGLVLKTDKERDEWMKG